uniref:Amidase domain-containing protein n=1 Tax=Brassica oleracea TaxID=3712 RepID=A0A3P6CQZ3_BRAOL|nr:unnamed protein product [Brassica oleracea]
MKKTQVLALALLRRKCRLVTGVVSTSRCVRCAILNKTAIFGDNGTISPGGTPEATTRGCIESDSETIADFLMKATHITTFALQYEMHASSYQRDIATAQQVSKTSGAPAVILKPINL